MRQKKTSVKRQASVNKELELLDAIQENEATAKSFVVSPLVKIIKCCQEVQTRRDDFVSTIQPNMEEQLKFWSSPAKMRVILGGNRAGKTFASAVDVVWSALGRHPHRYTPKPPLNIWIVGLTTSWVVGIMVPLLKKLIPSRCIQDINETYKRYLLTNGSTITIKTSSSGPEKFTGEKLHLVWIDEEQLDDRVIQEIRFRLIDYGGDFIQSATPVYGKKYLRELVKEDGVAVFRPSVYDNKFIDQKRAKLELDKLPPELRKVRAFGDFSDLTGVVFPEFSRRSNIVEPFKVPNDWPIYFILDPGLTVTQAIWFAVSPENRYFAIMAYRGEGRNVEANSFEINKIENLLGLKPKIVKRIIDAAAQSGSASNTNSVQSLYARHDIKCLLSHREKNTRIEMLRMALNPRRRDNGDVYPDLCFFNISEMNPIFEEFETKTYKQESLISGKPELSKGGDHGIDCCGYFIESRPRSNDLEIQRFEGIRRLLDQRNNDRNQYQRENFLRVD